MQKKVVITGGDGFIGSHLIAHLTAKGYEVYALIIPNSPTRSRIEGYPNVTIIECDLLNYEELAALLPEAPAAFFHFAWAGVSPEGRQSFEIQKENYDLTAAAVRLAAKLHSGKFIFLGSTMEYSYCGRSINREAAPSPQNAYGAVKIGCRYLCEVLCNELKLDFIYAVISGVYSEDRMDNNVIYYTISSLLDGKKPKLTRLEQLWDYVHIDDVINALALIIQSGKGGSFYTIGHGDNWPLANYIYKIRDLIDPEAALGIGEVPYNSDRMPMTCVDLRAITEDTGFVPVISFDEGISLVIDRVRARRQEEK